ncbi:MAG TPA: Mur ligase domain-containing protein [Turneriella sp.]|nr:Mur ligase domain-containing protein [Turneriella sp.]
MEIIHIIGAGGVGMSALALLAKRRGATITASDKNNSSYLQKLASHGIHTWVGSQPEKIPQDAHVYYSSAVKADDPERDFAETHGFLCEPRHSLLKRITADYFTIAIAGCHGKTTTSAWLADLLIRAGKDPTALIGGTVPEWQSNYREGSGKLHGKPILVMEADESDRSFLSIDVDIALITNVDLDHTDIHQSLAALENDFCAFADTARQNNGNIFLSSECDGALLARLTPAEKEARAQVIIAMEKHSIAAQGMEYPVGLAGVHNLKNATLIVQLGLTLGIPPTVIAASLQEFSGVNRRMQRIATFPERHLTVIDDYAHHPHEVEATLAALEPQYDRLLIFWEPHRLSRFVHFYREFAAVLEKYAAEHQLFLLPIYASGHKAEDYPHYEKLFQQFTKSHFVYIAQPSEFSLEPLALDGRNTAAVFMGAGASSEYAQAFVEFVRQQLTQKR